MFACPQPFPNGGVGVTALDFAKQKMVWDGDMFSL